MPRFYFDIQNGERFTRDAEGSELPDLVAVREEAVAVLPEIARNNTIAGESHEFVVSVRDETDRPILRARLTLSAEWLIDDLARTTGENL